MSRAHGQPSKRLYVRLSSLGDVILATSTLEVRSASSTIDWLTSRELTALIEKHPRIRRVLGFDRSSKLRGWIELCRKLWDDDYDEVYDLHSTLRTRLMRLCFTWWALVERKPLPRWKRISKQRFRLYGYFALKGVWPKAFRPDPVTVRSAQLVGGSGEERPNASHLLQSEVSPALQALLKQLEGRKYLCVMPGSKWAAKKWPVERFAELLERASSSPQISKGDSRSLLVVIMGAPSDVESQRLVELLRERKIESVSAVGAWNLKEVAHVLSGAWRYFGNDTGLAHLAEAVGVPSLVLFGPTREDMGFGPWRSESRAIGKALVCRPCGKDGRYCYRLGQRFACLKALSAQEVLAQVPELTQK